MQMYILLLCCILHLIQPHYANQTPNKLPQLLRHNFQANFLDQLVADANSAALESVDEFIRALQVDEDFKKYTLQFADILRDSPTSAHENVTFAHASAANRRKQQNLRNNARLDQKVIFLKELIDVKRTFNQESFNESIYNIYALRNLKFIKKLRLQLYELQDESARELRELKIYQLCRQFRIKPEQQLVPALQRSLFAHIKLAPLVEAELRSTTPRPSGAIIPYKSLTQFSSLLYERIKQSGCEIFDEYLTTVRRLLLEVIEEKSSETVREHHIKFSHLVQELDEVLEIEDFAQKRRRVYDYLQTNLTNDFEMLKDSEAAQHDLTDLLSKLKRRGLDMFVMFLFSNFEFLERIHEEWAKLLKVLQASEHNLAELDTLREISRLYKHFKQYPEDMEAYESYTAKVNELSERSKDLGLDPINMYDILQNASQNVGSVTLNMIKGKCEEI